MKGARVREGWDGLLRAAELVLLLLTFNTPQVTAVASFRVAVQVHRAAPGGGHLEHREQRGFGAVAV